MGYSPLGQPNLGTKQARNLLRCTLNLHNPLPFVPEWALDDDPKREHNARLVNSSRRVAQPTSTHRLCLHRRRHHECALMFWLAVPLPSSALHWSPPRCLLLQQWWCCAATVVVLCCNSAGAVLCCNSAGAVLCCNSGGAVLQQCWCCAGTASNHQHERPCTVVKGKGKGDTGISARQN